MFRASRLLDAATAQRTYELCASDKHDAAFVNSTALLHELTGAIGTLELSFDADALRVRAIASRTRARLPQPEATLPDVQDAAKRAVATFDRLESVGKPQPAPAAHAQSNSVGQLVETATRELRELLPGLTTVLLQVAATDTCNDECAREVVAECRDDAPPPADMRMPPSGGIAFSPRTNTTPPSSLHTSDPGQAEWMWETFAEMCETCNKLLPTACKIAGATDHRQTRMFPGVLLAAALRADLEDLPGQVGECGSRSLREMLKRIRSGTPPLAVLSGLRFALAKETGAAAKLRAASELIALFGDVLPVSDQLELERALPSVVHNVDRFTQQCHPAADVNAAPCPKPQSKTALGELGREIFLLNQLSTNALGSNEATEDGYQLMLATIRTLSAAMVAVRGDVPAHGKSKWAPPNFTSWYTSLCATTRMLSGKYADGVLYLDALKSKAQLYRVLPLIVSLAAEQTPTGVSAAIDSVAPVVTTVDLKTQSPQLNLAGELGPAVTYDLPISAPRGVDPVFVGGLSASLGFALTTPLSFLLQGSYLHIYASVVDVGQIVTTPLFAPDSARGSGENRRTVRPSPTTDLRLSQVLAPGLFIGISWPHTMLVASCGVSTAPSLREYEIRDIGDKKLNSEQYSVYRIGCRFAIDTSVVRFF